MGIAAGDLNLDGRIDLFITNYFNEANTFYANEGGGLFSDVTRTAELREPSFRLLGFGTQALDVNSDGLPDLVVANGHIDDFTYLGQPYRMRPQLFINSGGRFREVAREAAGTYFQDEHLGRGMAMLDWNHDQRLDFSVSHLDTPVALVLNGCESPDPGWTLQLVGVRSARQPFGTTVVFETGDGRQTRQLTAGSGYQASNQPLLHFAAGDSSKPGSLIIRWSSGAEQSLSAPSQPTGRWLAVEGSPSLRRLP